MTLELQDALACVESVELGPRCSGQVSGVGGGLIQARGIRAALGAICRVGTSGLLAEVVALRGEGVCLAPLGEPRGLARGALVEELRDGLRLPAPSALLGHVVDALGTPLSEGCGPLPLGPGLEGVAPPLSLRRPIERALPTGVAAIDGLLTVGRGQRVGIFAGSGVGKSTLTTALVRNAVADVVVVCLVGERGREVAEFHASLGAQRARTIVVAATSDAPAALRMLAPETAIRLAEELRDAGQDVLLVVDSLTRFALAGREVGITAGEPPSARGFPPSVFARLPRLLERLGRLDAGSITALVTVLVEGDRIEDDPVADALRGLLDGHIVLSRELAERGHYPAIDVLASVSRTQDQVIDEEQRASAARVRVLLAALRRAEELREIGAYRRGTDPLMDEALAKADVLRQFLVQDLRAPRPYVETWSALAALGGGNA